jgi:hypothetical protein
MKIKEGFFSSVIHSIYNNKQASMLVKPGTISNIRGSSSFGARGPSLYYVSKGTAGWVGSEKWQSIFADFQYSGISI